MTPRPLPPLAVPLAFALMLGACKSTLTNAEAADRLDASTGASEGSSPGDGAGDDLGAGGASPEAPASAPPTPPAPGAPTGSADAGSTPHPSSTPPAGPPNPGPGGDDMPSGDAGADAGIGEGPTNGKPPAGTIPVFLAIGLGGRSIISCDGGHSWVADTFDATQDGLHESYTPKSVTYAYGKFLYLTGWGVNSTVRVSDNGVDWMRVPLDTTFGGVGYDRGRYVLLGSHYYAASDDGYNWRPLENVPQYGPNRDASAFDGLWIAGANGRVGVRVGDANMWLEPAGCQGVEHGSVGISSGHAMGDGVVISVGRNGTTCGVDAATGTSLGQGSIGNKFEGEPAFIKDEFWAAYQGTLWKSDDGVSWTSEPLPDGVDFQLVAYEPTSDTYVAIDRKREVFYRSDDGKNWTRVDVPSSGGGTLITLIAGYGKPSSPFCPTP